MIEYRRVRRMVAISSLAFALTASILNHLSAEPTEPPATATATEVKPGRPTATQSVISQATVEVKQEHRFNELRREFLESRVKLVDWWLTGTAIFLTLFGILVVLIGYLGYRRFREIEAEARKNVVESKQHADEAARLVTQIKTKRDEAESVLKDMNAEIAATKPERASEAAESVKKNPAASLIDRARADALLLQRQGKFEEALRKWRSIANIVEGADQGFEAQAWFSVGYLSCELADYKAAIDAYDNVLRLNPNLAVAYNNRGNAKHGIGQYEDAIKDRDKAIQLDPNYAVAYNNRGNAKRAMSQYEDAIKDYDKALQLDLNLAVAYNNRGNTKHEMGQHEDAIKDCDKALQLDPNLAVAYNNRGNAKHAMGQHEDAIKDYDKTMQLAPNYAAAYNNRGNAKRAMCQYEDAIKDCDKAIQLDPNLAAAYCNRGVANSKLGRVNEARQDFRKTLILAREAGDKKMEAEVERLLAGLDKPK